MKRKLELNQCKKCQRTYNTKEVNATPDTCSHCNEKQRGKVRKKDALRKSLSRNENDKPCDNLEKLADIVNDLNMPLFRAKKINSNEYVVGYLEEHNPNDFYISLLPNRLSAYAIDISTLSINFNDMTDSQGNKIFASLNEDGKGGDILDRNGMTFKTIYKSVNGRFEAYEIGGMHNLLAHKFHQSKVIGIQE